MKTNLRVFLISILSAFILMSCQPATPTPVDNTGTNNEQCETTGGCGTDTQTLVDTDFDGVSDQLDLCANTPTNALVDQQGCSSSQTGANQYEAYCATCHGANGLGKADNPAGLVDYPLDVCVLTDCTDFDTLSAYLDTSMSANTGNQCTAANGCSQNVAQYMIDNIVTMPEDADNDGITDNLDMCANTPAGTTVDAKGCDYNLDDDDDGVVNSLDQCPATEINSFVDAVGCKVDAATDNDKDGVENSVDQCPNTQEGTVVDANGCMMDADNDGVQDRDDQCSATTANAVVDTTGCSDLQTGANHYEAYCAACHGKDGLGKSDTPPGLVDYPLEVCSLTDCTDFNTLSAYLNSAMAVNTGNACTSANGCSQSVAAFMIDQIVLAPVDTDNDGIHDGIDACSNTAANASVDANGCAQNQLDDDKDGVTNNVDQCADTPLGSVVDAQGCPAQAGGDMDDDDNDSVINLNDICPNTPSTYKDIVDTQGCSSYDRGLANYFSKLGGDKSCADCHGDEGNGGNGGGPINGICVEVNCQDMPALTTYISTQMPYQNVGLCGESATSTCSSDIASFMHESFYKSDGDLDFDGIADEIDMCPDTQSEDLKSIDHTGCVNINGTSGSVYAINVGGDAFTTQAGLKYKADDAKYYEGSLGSTMGELSFDVINTDDDQLYRKERWGKTLTYKVPVDNGVYSVELHFSEVFFTEAGKRLMDVTIEGNKVITGYDQFAQTGGKNYAGMELVENILVADQEVTIFLEGTTNNASIVGINVIGVTSNDADSDGLDDKKDSCPGTKPNAVVNEQGCSDEQRDKDGDGILIPLDQCENTLPDEVNTVALTGDLAGCSLRVRSIDDDNDDIANVIDNCKQTPVGSKVGVTGCTGLKDLPVASIVSPQMRLTKQEYINTVMQAFGVDTLPVATYLEDTSGPFSAYSNNAADNSADFSSLLGSAQTLAGSLAASLVDSCDWTGSPRNCVTQNIQGALKILYRENTYLDSDKEALGAAIASARDAGADEEAALSVALTFALVDDRMVYKMEFGEDRSAFGKAKLTDREFINRLSYLLVGNSPDTQLVSAQVGIIEDDLAIEDQANRLMSQDAYKDMVWKFVAQWLRMAVEVPEIADVATPVDPIVGDQCNNTGQCQTLYAGLASTYDCKNSASDMSYCECDGGRCDTLAASAPTGMPLEDAMQIETRLFVDYIIDNNLPLTELFTADYSFIDSTLAEHYGVTAPNTAWEKYTFPAGVGRQGILTHASFLFHNGDHGRDVNTIFRGKIVYERLFCDAMPPPPPAEDSVDLADEVSDRGVHPSCSGCHSVVDPIGRMFDLYDDDGKRFDQANLKGGLYMDVDVADEYADVVAFSSALEESHAFKQCVSRQFFRFAMGRDAYDAETQSFDEIHDALETDGTFNSAVKALVNSDAYKYVYSQESTMACEEGAL